jgi:mRNA-degrading endonuclease RelE of RelBE toxin-antitoxin system
MTKVRVSGQVESFVKSLAPEPRRALRTGIKSLASQPGDIKHLEGDLAGWNRLRVHTYRIVFKEVWQDGQRLVDCVYANRRSVV